MTIYRYICLLLTAILVLPVTASSFPTGNSPQEEYIAKYSAIAVKERQRSGIPASITLAQGMLESSNGLSDLAVRGRNHFGIKCHDWKGARIYFDDDRKGECFRKYKTVEESYRDHSDFLRYRDRYKFLFNFKVTDYKSWAYGLKKAGYATDPSYPKKLIRIIEDYDLVRFDRRSLRDLNRIPESERRSSRKDRKEPEEVQPEMSADESVEEAVQNNEIPETPENLETPVPVSDRQGKFNVSLSRQVYSQNKVPFIYSEAGDTYASLAKKYNLFKREILNFNDLDEEESLAPGTVVYLQRKKSKGARHLDKYIAEGGETVYGISQRYGVRMKNILKLNGFERNHVLREGDTVKLRK